MVQDIIRRPYWIIVCRMKRNEAQRKSVEQICIFHSVSQELELPSSAPDAHAAIYGWLPETPKETAAMDGKHFD